MMMMIIIIIAAVVELEGEKRNVRTYTFILVEGNWLSMLLLTCAWRVISLVLKLIAFVSVADADGRKRKTLKFCHNNSLHFA